MDAHMCQYPWISYVCTMRKCTSNPPSWPDSQDHHMIFMLLFLCLCWFRYVTSRNLDSETETFVICVFINRDTFAQYQRHENRTAPLPMPLKYVHRELMSEYFNETSIHLHHHHHHHHPRPRSRTTRTQNNLLPVLCSAVHDINVLIDQKPKRK